MHAGMRACGRFRVQDEKDRTPENEEALLAGTDPDEKNRFLEHHRNRILRLTGRITGKLITESDEEWSAAFLAVSYALDTYLPAKGDFWPYVALVIRSQLGDYYRTQARHSAEVSMRPDVFEGNLEEEDPDFSVQAQVQSRIAHTADTSLRDEIIALQEELEAYDISFFDLAQCSPKAGKTRQICSELVGALFSPPPPLVPEMRRKKTLPVKKLLERAGATRKLADRYRKYLITSALILDGDYPGLAEYLDYIKKDLTAEGGNLA